MSRRLHLFLGWWLRGLLGSLALAGCEAPATVSFEGEIERQVVVDTQDDLAWRQYLANVRFAQGYQQRCALADDPGRARRRVLLTGFGRFLGNRENATGRLVSRLVPAAVYPLSSPPSPGMIDDPVAQTSVALSTLVLPGLGEVDVCAMILPVFWDLSAFLVLREAAAFRPDVIFMNGIARDKQPMWMELGGVNAATALQDGSGLLTPIEEGAPLLHGLPEEAQAEGLLLSWAEVRAAAEAAIARLAAQVDGQGRTFGSILQGIRLASFPRPSNTYLCNNTTFTVNHILGLPWETFRLLEASHARGKGTTGIELRLGIDLGAVPREFLHWPSLLGGTHLDRAATVLRAILAAQLGAATPPTRGDPALGEEL